MLTSYSAPLLLASCLGGTAFELPDTMYLDVTTTPSTYATAGTPSGLARVELDMTTLFDDDEATGTSLELVSFEEAEADLGVAVYGELWDALTAGNRWLYNPLSGTEEQRTITAGKVLTIPIGSLLIRTAQET